MKRIVSLLLIVIFCLSLCGCEQEKDYSNANVVSCSGYINAIMNRGFILETKDIECLYVQYSRAQKELLIADYVEITYYDVAFSTRSGLYFDSKGNVEEYTSKVYQTISIKKIR